MTMKITKSQNLNTGKPLSDPKISGPKRVRVGLDRLYPMGRIIGSRDVHGGAASFYIYTLKNAMHLTRRFVRLVRRMAFFL